MKYQEKKYRVESLAAIRKKLFEVGAKEGKEVVATHYYVRQAGDGVVKLVEYKDRSEIHILVASNGRFSLRKNILVENTKAGLQWLKDKGYRMVGVVQMAQVDYEYKGGIVGLYLIDDWLHSVILDFPVGKHETIEKGLGLQAAEIIRVPYNTYLEQLGRLRSMELN